MISIVIPLYNEVETIPELYRQLAENLKSLDEPAEVIFVNDGSADRSMEALRSIAQADASVKVIDLARNFGHQVAISAGIDCAAGDAIVLMDGDLQDPPDLIRSMVAQWRNGFEVVYATKRSRKDQALKRLAFRSFYELMQRFSSIPIPMEAGNFSLMDRKVIRVLQAMPERNRYIPGMRAWAGFRQIGIEFDRPGRFAGNPRMTLGRLMHLAFDGLFSFSNAPLRFATYVGVVSAIFSFLGILYVLYAKIFTEKATPGWASPVFSILFIGGLILLTLGIIGEYLGRIYDEVKQRPLYVIKEKIGFN